MKISVVGTGRMGRGLARLLDEYAEGVIQWGSRSEDKVRSMVKEGGFQRIRPVSVQEALEADLIIPGLWFRDLLPWAKEHEGRLYGKILVDIANPFNEDFSGFTTEWGDSAAEQLQRALPHTRIAGAFKNTFFKVLADPVHQGQTSDVYVTADDETAKRTVMGLLKDMPFRVLDGGSLSNNRIIERMTLFEREVALKYGNYPYVAYRMFGLND